MNPQAQNVKPNVLPSTAHQDIVKFFEWDSSTLKQCESANSCSSEESESSESEEEILVQVETSRPVEGKRRGRPPLNLKRFHSQISQTDNYV